jgi:hypothetical protein
MPVVVVRAVDDMSLDDVMIAISLGGLLLSGTYIGAGFRESRRKRDFQVRRSERAAPPRSKPTKRNEAAT